MATRAKRLPADERRHQVLDCALQLLAEKGFEGLRIRDIASRVGVNSATLHHYFATKQDLVEAVATHLSRFYGAHRAPALPREQDVPDSLRLLRQEFADAAFYRAEFPNILSATLELTLRAQRDEEVARLIAPLHQHWTGSVERVLSAGVDAGVFRSDLEPRALSLAIVASLWGMSALLHLTDTEFSRACRALERSVLVSR
jgi:TetR/AcrR family transcriptional regulator, regulator of cefoperazone and chloramphenicol sensitivity